MNQVKKQVMIRLKEFREEVLAAGEELDKLPLPEITEEAFGLYERTGNRLEYEKVYFGRRKALAVFGLLSIWYHREEDLKRLGEIIRLTCEERTWALPAHVDRTSKSWERTVDLFACETGQTLAEIASLLKDDLPCDLVAMAEREVVSRLIDSYLEQPFGTIRWEKFRNNWVAVCAGCLGSIAIDLLNDDEEKQGVCLNRVKNTMALYLEGMMDDGTCPEGLSYFSYGMAYFAGFAEKLREFSGGSVDLMENPKIERIARFQQLCFFDRGVTVSFSDGNQRDKFRLGLTCYLAMRYPSVALPPMESVMKLHDDTCYRFMALYRDDSWARRFLEQKESQSGWPNEWFSVLRDAQWAIGRSENGVGMAIKGGSNGEPHNHNDIGSFLYEKDGEEFLTDLGCGEYTKEYFGEGRYRILCNRSLGHNVPVINGKEQEAGIDFCAESFQAGEENSDLTRRDCQEGNAFGGVGKVKISMAGAYPAGLMAEITREAAFERSEGKFTVTDTFVPACRPIAVTENFVTQMEPEIRADGSVLLTGKRSRVCIRAAGVCGRPRVVKERFINHRGGEERVWLLQWDVTCQEAPVKCSIEISVCENYERREETCRQESR